MTLRKLPGAASLGLLAFLAAHAATFGGGHEVGGAYHAIVQMMALAAVAAFALGGIAIAWSGRGEWADGSIFASRLGTLLPGARATLGAAIVWYAIVERAEATHATAALPLVLAALLVAAWLVRLGARALLRFIGAIAITVSRPRFAPRTHAWLRRAHRVVRPISEPARLARFARPPPGSMHVACI